MKIAISLFILVVIYSCKNSNNNAAVSTNEDVKISKEIVIIVLEELMLIETHLQSKYYTLGNYKDALILSRDSILRSRKINLSQFNSSFNYYAQSDKQLIDMYESILNNLNEKSAKAILKSK